MCVLRYCVGAAPCMRASCCNAYVVQYHRTMACCSLDYQMDLTVPSSTLRQTSQTCELACGGTAAWPLNNPLVVTWREEGPRRVRRRA